MISARKALVLTFTTVAVLCTAWVNPVQTPDDANLRKKALALNNVTGDDPIKGEIKALVEDAAATKKLLGVATRMAQDKPQPFTYNGAFILARAALQLKELDAAQTLYKVCFEQASKLRSSQKLVQAYLGMEAVIQLLYLDKKYEKSAKVAQEFLEVLEKLEQEGGSKALKADVLRNLIRAMTKQGKVPEATRMVDNLIKVRPADWRNLELRAWLERELRHYEAATKAYQQVLAAIAKDDSLRPEEKAEFDAEARLAIADMLFLDKKFDKSARAAQELLDSLEKQGVSAQGKAEVIRRLVRALAQQGKVKEAAKLLEKIGADEPGDIRNLELKAWILRESGSDAEAAKLYEDMLVRVQKADALDKETKQEYENDIRYLLSSVYIDMDKVDKAVDQLQALLKKDPNNATYNNDLGYIWADHDQNLAEAEKLIRKALDLDRQERKKRPDFKPDEDKDNAAYVDSLGWVLYKLKNYKDAKKYLLEAIKDKEGQHIEIMDHLGDVHMALGEKADAVNVWKKVVGMETKTKREKERKAQVEKKLKANQ